MESRLHSSRLNSRQLAIIGQGGEGGLQKCVLCIPTYLPPHVYRVSPPAEFPWMHVYQQSTRVCMVVKRIWFDKRVSNSRQIPGEISHKWSKHSANAGITIHHTLCRTSYWFRKIGKSMSQNNFSGRQSNYIATNSGWNGNRIPTAAEHTELVGTAGNAPPSPVWSGKTIGLIECDSQGTATTKPSIHPARHRMLREQRLVLAPRVVEHEDKRLLVPRTMTSHNEIGGSR